MELSDLLVDNASSSNSGPRKKGTFLGALQRGKSANFMNTSANLEDEVNFNKNI